MLQSSSEAIPFLESAHRQFHSLWEDRRIDGRLASEYLRNASLLGLAYDESKRSDEAIQVIEGSLDRFSKYTWSGEPPFSAKLARANSLNNLGLFAMHQSQATLASRSFEQALELLNDALKEAPDSLQAMQLKGATLSNFASFLSVSDNQKSVTLLLESVELLKRSSGSSGMPATQPLGLALNSLAVGQLHLGRAAEANDSVQMAIEIQRVLLAKSPRNRTYKLDLASSLNNHGLILLQNEQRSKAKELSRKVTVGSTNLRRGSPRMPSVVRAWEALATISPIARNATRNGSKLPSSMLWQFRNRPQPSH